MNFTFQFNGRQVLPPQPRPVRTLEDNEFNEAQEKAYKALLEFNKFSNNVIDSVVNFDAQAPSGSEADRRKMAKINLRKAVYERDYEKYQQASEDYEEALVNFWRRSRRRRFLPKWLQEEPPTRPVRPTKPEPHPFDNTGDLAPKLGEVVLSGQGNESVHVGTLHYSPTEWVREGGEGVPLGVDLIDLKTSDRGKEELLALGLGDFVKKYNLTSSKEGDILTLESTHLHRKHHVAYVPAPGVPERDMKVNDGATLHRTETIMRIDVAKNQIQFEQTGQQKRER